MRQSPRGSLMDALKGDKSGASGRIAAGGEFVTSLTARIARDPQRRIAAEKGLKVRRMTCNRWLVEWSDDRTPAEAIVEKLLADDDLARTVYKRLHSKNVANAAKDKRRSTP